MQNFQLGTIIFVLRHSMRPLCSSQGKYSIMASLGGAKQVGLSLIENFAMPEVFNIAFLQNRK
jgi:hypothetical protein